MIKDVLCIAALAALLVGAAFHPARAQSPAAQKPAAPAQAAAARGLTADEARQALDTLQDPKKRDELIAVLKAIAAAAPAAAPPASPESAAPETAAPAKEAATPAVTLKPHSLGAELLAALTRWSAGLADEVAATARAMTNLPELSRWLDRLATDRDAESAFLVSALWVAVVILCALALEYLSLRLLRRPRRTLTRHLPHGNGVSSRLLRVLPYALIGLVLDLLPVAVFAAAGNLLSGMIAGLGEQTRLIVLTVVNAYAVCRVVMCCGRLLVSPADRRLRLWRLDDAGARFVIAWLRRIVVVVVFGDAAIEAALLLGLDQSAHDGLERLISLVMVVMLIVVVIRSRAAVGGYLRAPGAGGDPARWRSRLADTWPYLAILVIVTGWGGLVAGGGRGLAGLYFPGVTLAAVIGARLVTIVVLGTLERAMRLDPQTDEKLPGLAPRIARYRRPAELAAVAIIFALSAVVLLQLWGVAAFAWFVGGSVGGRLVSALLTVAIAVVAAILLWEATHAALEHQLARLGENGRSGRSARLMTLLPMLRTALLTAILTVIGLTALSEIGVNIAPLLAGAGIVGIAIGFGAQHLVQDVITGVFVLFENAIQIGDNVTVAGLTGSIEQLSVRTIRLRAGDGAVHIIPFSAVTSITNTNRGLGNATVSVTVAYSVDTDRVVEVLKDIAAGMREEADFTARMLGDLQIWGVDQVRPWGVTIAGQIPCTDTGRWAVQREFNRRLKKRFEELDIELGGSPQAVARAG